MQTKTLIILILMASLCSGLAFSQNSASAGKVLQYFASMYMPSDNQRSEKVMTFGRELLASEESQPEIPERTFLK